MTIEELQGMIEIRKRVTEDPEATRIAHEIAVRVWFGLQSREPYSNKMADEMVSLADAYEARTAVLIGRQPARRSYV